MNLTNIIPAKEFAEIDQRSLSESLEDCDISDDVLSESSPQVLRQRRPTISKPKSKFCKLKRAVYQKYNSRREIAYGQKLEDLHKMSKSAEYQQKQNRKDSAFFRSNDDLAEKSSTNLKSDISSLLQLLIRKKRDKQNTAESINPRRRISPVEDKKASPFQQYDNYLLTMGDLQKTEDTANVFIAKPPQFKD
ncbi:unnamed protein product [Moneuplotes crassus]|uniref:Uncharacterized protein n=1 Tax=Euplotes crassus TaxID=5936 RepID=A0AAD2DC20_EUPCR|nr:unnamed protein product [Moneuplotes crassus]